MFKKKKIGLALGGGAAKGLAHIGVLKALEENNIKIDMISGTSIGALIGGLYCAGNTPEEIEKMIQETNLVRLLDMRLSKKGLIKGDKIEKHLRDNLEEKSFSDLGIPLYIPAVDIIKGQEIIFNKGDIAKAIRASISIPGIFRPVENKGRVLIDGGILDNLPMKVLKDQGADIIIAVNLFNKKKKSYIFQEATKETDKKKSVNMIKTIINSINLTERDLSYHTIKNHSADILITPNLEEISYLDFNKSKKAIRIGEEKTRLMIKEIKRKKSLFRRITRI